MVFCSNEQAGERAKRLDYLEGRDPTLYRRHQDLMPYSLLPSYQYL
jgi:hypothetical protein